MEHLVNRLYGEYLVSNALFELDLAQSRAQSSSNALSMLPKYPVLDRQIELMFAHRQSMYEQMNVANKWQRKLEKAIQFYLGTY